jgi:hypothetical protein
VAQLYHRALSTRLHTGFFIPLRSFCEKTNLSLCVLHHEGVWGSGCIDPHTLDLGTIIVDGEWSASRPSPGLVDVAKRILLPLPGLYPRHLGSYAHSQSLSQLPRTKYTFYGTVKISLPNFKGSRDSGCDTSSKYPTELL